MAKDQAYKEAEKKIEEALQSGATELDLSNQYDESDETELTELPESIWKLKQLTSLKLSFTKLTALPDSLGQLSQLTDLNLSGNLLTTVPDSLGQLTQLTELNLSSNKLTTLPDSLGQLTQLTELNLSSNQLITLPPSLGQLTQLQKLFLQYNQISELPECLQNLTQLKELYFGGDLFISFPNVIRLLTNITDLRFADCRFDYLPEWIGELVNLQYFLARGCQFTSVPYSLAQIRHLNQLYLDGNKLSDLPSSIAHLENLKELSLADNPLNPALQSAYNACERGKYEPLFAYLHSLEQNAEPLYEAKLVLVGEGNVGKTTLLKALKGKAGEAPQEHEPTTHGVEIDIHGLRLPHPAMEGIKIQLNAWDFGGQDVYRVTHQFFFSRRSLYLLVWEPRRGVQQGQVEDWLNMIRLRVGDDARVIIVSTHCKTGERIARIDQPVFKQQYGDMIVGFHEVDSLVRDEATGEMVGITELKKVIAEHASKLEQMGMGFNRDWKAARDELLARPEPRISFGPSSDGETFSGVCTARGLSGIDTETLAHLMHDLGYIVHYSDDEKLRDDIILKPEWLTKAIGFVLEDRATAESEGILPDKHLYEVWHDHQFKDEPRYDADVYPFFLRLMEKYDVCYRLPDDRKASLVAQHVPQIRPELPWLPEQNPPANLRRIAMICAMEEDPPGLVPWMIVRTHDYAYPVGQHSLHWQKGMFLRNDRHGEAMLELRGREFHMYAEAIWPEYFMNILRQTLDKLITDNWPGMQGRYSFTVPCKNNDCEGRFEIAALRDFLNDGDETIRCQKCRERQNIIELLYGFEDRPVDIQLQEINQRLAGLDSRVANYFMATMRAIADEAKDGPRLFTFRSGNTKLPWKQLVSRPMELQLWCEHESHPHPVLDSGKGVYQIDQPYEWIIKIAPYANIALDILRIVAPITAPAINSLKGPKTTETLKIADYLELAKEISDKLPAEIKTPDRALTPGKLVSEQERSGILALHNLLKELDPTQAKLGLHRVATYTGDFRWLCKQHYDAWQPNIPDVIR